MKTEQRDKIHVYKEIYIHTCIHGNKNNDTNDFIGYNHQDIIYNYYNYTITDTTYCTHTH